MKKKMVTNLRIARGVKKLNKPKLVTVALACTTISLGSLYGVPRIVQAQNSYKEVLDIDYNQGNQESADELSMKLYTEMQEKIEMLKQGKTDYENYLSSLARHYGLSKESVRNLIENHMNLLLEQDHFEEAIKKMITHQIKIGAVEATKPEIKTTKKKVRVTTYQYTPDGSEKQLGGTLGLIAPYLKEGSVHFDANGFAILKGGTTSKHNGNVYGKKGKNYLIVAAATKYLIGQYGYKQNHHIKYYDYNDTFKLEVTTKRGKKIYDAIVLDSCGASMDWSITSTGKHAPETTKEKQYCEDTNCTKIDVFTAPLGDTRLNNPKDVGYQVKQVVEPRPELVSLTSEAKAYIEETFVETTEPKLKVNYLY